MDELLLQLTETLRNTKGLTSLGVELRDIAELTCSVGFKRYERRPALPPGGSRRRELARRRSAHDVDFVPATQPDGAVGTVGRQIEYDVTDGEVCYDDNAGSLTEQRGTRSLMITAPTSSSSSPSRPGLAAATDDAFLNSLS
jgi:hypothetical protein